MAMVTLRGKSIRTSGELPPTGQPAPDFILVDQRLDDKTLADFTGRRKLLYIVPSVDTPVCAASAKQFSERLAEADGAAALLISADLPFAMGRFCKGAGLKGLQPLSMMRSRRFARDYGVLMMDGPLAGLCARAVVVLDKADTVVYTELVEEITREPDYESALAAL